MSIKKSIPNEEAFVKWGETRKKGKSQFVFRWGIVFFIQTWSVICLVLYFSKFGFQLPDFMSQDWETYLFITVPTNALVGVIASYYTGSRLWDKYEKQYKDYVDKKH